MEVKILGSGCANCTKLYNNTVKALDELGKSYTILKVEDFAQIMEMGVMKTPALVIDGNVKAFGKVLSVDEVKDLL